MFSTKMLVVLVMSLRFSETWIVTASILNQAEGMEPLASAQEDIIKEVPKRKQLLRNRGDTHPIESTQDILEEYRGKVANESGDESLLPEVVEAVEKFHDAASLADGSLMVTELASTLDAVADSFEDLNTSDLPTDLRLALETSVLRLREVVAKQATMPHDPMVTTARSQIAAGGGGSGDDVLVEATGELDAAELLGVTPRRLSENYDQRVHSSKKRSKPDAHWSKFHTSAKSRHHFDLQDAILKGDHAYLEQKLESWTKKANVYANQDSRHGRGLFEDDYGSRKSQCGLLVGCVNQMSLYDLVIYNYFDNIDFDSGEIDDNVVQFDDDDLLKKAVKIAGLAKAAELSGFTDTAKCDALLVEFHRAEETDFGFKWKGGVVTEVCLASGTTQYVKLEEIRDKLGENGVKYARYIFLDALFCAQTLFASDDRTGDTRFAADKFVFTTDENVLRIPYAVNSDRDNRNAHGQLTNTDPKDFFTFYDFDDTGFTLNDLRNGQCAQTENPISLKCADENVESSQKFYDVITLEFWRSLLDGVFCRFLFFDRSTCDENDAFDEGVIEGRYFDVALELIFGEKPSVGKICGITESVIDETSDSIPGTCCLDSPAQSDNEDMGSVWGQPYTCDEPCENYAPYLAGMTVETCDVYGGKWCQNPQDCTVLRDCVAGFIELADEERETGIANRTGFVKYLESSPEIIDPLDEFDCGRAREYFGFPDTYTNDQQICEDIGELRNTRNFEILEGFFSGSSGGGSDSGDLELEAPEEPGYTESAALKWRASNFAVKQALDTVIGLLDVFRNVECVADALGVVNAACVVVKASASNAILVVSLAINVGLEISVFMYGEEVGTNEVLATDEYLRVKVLHPNQVKIYKEVLCRSVEALLPGHGCDGVDNNCDYKRDECDEDAFHPVIGLSRVAELCGGDQHVFQSDLLARECVKTHVSAVDDCSSVTTYVQSTTEDDPGDSLSICGTTKRIKVIAVEDQCSKSTEDDSILVLVDTNILSPSCKFSQGPDVSPILDVSQAVELCSGKIIYQNIEEAERCVLANSKADDGCRMVDIVVVNDDVTGDQDKALSICTSTYEIVVTATVRGCSLSTSTSILVLVDPNTPPPSCEFSKGPDVQPLLDTSRAVEFCDGEIFASISDAETCILNNSVGQDAAGSCRPVDVTLSIVKDSTLCGYSIKATSTIRDCTDPSLEKTAVINVEIDGEKPQVTCSFNASGTSLRERFVDGTLMILHASDDKLKDGIFSIGIEENCNDIVSVDALVTSNEFANEKMAQLVRQSTIATAAQQMKLFIAPTSCSDEGAPNVCIKEPSVDPRLYDIHVTATDQAGNEGSATCTVIIFSGTLLEGRNRVCGDFAVHARTTVTFSGGLTTIDDGDVGVSPGTAITGAPQINGGVVVGNSDVFATSVKVAYDAAMAVHFEETPIANEIGGSSFTPGTYRSGSAINFAAGTVILDGNYEANPEFLFIAGTTLVTAANTRFILKNGAKAENVIWALGTAATLGANSVLEGSILAGTAITFGAESELHGCALAQSAVTFESGGYIKARNGPGQTLEDVAPDVKASVIGSTQRFDLASLSLAWPPNSISNTFVHAMPKSRIKQEPQGFV